MRVFYGYKRTLAQLNDFQWSFKSRLIELYKAQDTNKKTKYWHSPRRRSVNRETVILVNVLLTRGQIHGELLHRTKVRSLSWHLKPPWSLLVSLRTVDSHFNDTFMVGNRYHCIMTIDIVILDKIIPRVHCMLKCMECSTKHVNYVIKRR